MSEPNPGVPPPPWQPHSAPSPSTPNRAVPPPPASREAWRSPAGISVIIAAVAVVVTVITFTIQEVRAREAPAAGAGPSVVATPGAPGGASSPTVGPAVVTTPPGSGTGTLETDALFVYGSSKPGQARFSYVERFVADAQPDAVEGLLYDTGADYPAAKFGIGDQIPGFVLRIKPDQVEDFFRQMDMIESGLFGRIAVTTSSGRRVQAYEWNGPTDGFTRIDSWEG